MLYCQKTYNDRLRKTIDDKLFFLTHVPDATVFIDIGCADGALAMGIDENIGRPYHYIGYDLSAEQITAARASRQEISAASFYHTIAETVAARKNLGGIGCVVLSSVIHEILSQGEDWSLFLAFLDSLDCKYIAVRDMAVTHEALSAVSNPADIEKIKAYPDITYRLESFTAKWGDIGLQSNMIHFLLKYRWLANWMNEIEENYIPVAFQDFPALFGPGYQPTYCEHSSLQHIQDVVKKDFGITLNDKTHIKMVLTR